MSDRGAALAWVIAAFAFCAAWLAASVWPIPQLWYLPLEGRVLFGAAPRELAMGLYGQLVFALTASAAVGTAGAAIIRKREIGAGALQLAIAAHAVFLVVAAGYYAITLWDRPLP